MNDQDYAKGVGFVASVLSTGIEKLPKNDVIPPVTSALPSEQGSERPQNLQEADAKERKSQQGIKRTCGHSHKSVRMDHKK